LSILSFDEEIQLDGKLVQKNNVTVCPRVEKSIGIVGDGFTEIALYSEQKDGQL